MTLRTAVVSIPANLVARDFIATGLVTKIAEQGFRVVLCCHRRDHDAVASMTEGMPVAIATYREAGFALDSAHALLADVRFSLQGTISGHMALVRKRLAASLMLRIWLIACQRLPVLASLVLDALESVLASRAASRTGALLSELGASIVITPGPGFRPEDRALLRAARQKNIPTVSVVSSWDNLTARGAVKCPADVIAVWNEPMRRHATQYHGLAPSRIAITGVPAFDAYVDVDQVISREQNAAYLGLHSGTSRYITFLTGMLVSQAECADIDAVLEGLDRAYPGGTAPTLVIRVHPNEDPGHYAAFRGHTGVRLNFEGPEHATAAQQLGASARAPIMNRDAHLRKAALLRYSDVVLASLCTTALVEASLFDRPVLAIERLRPDVDPAVQALIASLDSYTHQSDFRNSGALEVVTNTDDALRAIVNARTNPERLREERAVATALLCGPLDGRSTERVAELISRTVTASV